MNILKRIKKLNIKLICKVKGSYTVEAAMIFPLIMFIMFGIMYLTIIHYQNNVMIAESIRAMNRAGAYWQYIDMGMVQEGDKKKITKIDYNDKNIPFPFNENITAEGIINFRMIDYRNPYRSLIDIISEAMARVTEGEVNISKKKSNAKQYVKSRIANVKFKRFINEEDEKVGNVDGEGFMFFGDDLSIEVGRSYINPIKDLSKVLFKEDFFLNKAKIDKNIEVKGVISNQAEFIRNIDTVYDLGINVYNLIKVK